MAYEIVDWDELYENHDTRKLEHLRWVSVPIKHDGLGFRTIFTIDPTGRYFAAFVLMLQLAAKKKPRGIIPLSPGEMGIKTGMAGDTFKEAIPHLISIGWVKDLDADTNTDREISGGCREISAPEGNGIEVKGLKDSCAKSAIKHDDDSKYSQTYLKTWKEFWLDGALKRKHNHKDEGYKRWKARMKHFTEEQLYVATKSYAKECADKGTEPEFIQMAQTFYGKDAKMTDYLSQALPEDLWVSKDKDLRKLERTLAETFSDIEPQRKLLEASQSKRGAYDNVMEALASNNGKLKTLTSMAYNTDDINELTSYISRGYRPDYWGYDKTTDAIRQKVDKALKGRGV